MRSLTLAVVPFDDPSLKRVPCFICPTEMPWYWELSFTAAWKTGLWTWRWERREDTLYGGEKTLHVDQKWRLRGLQICLCLLVTLIWNGSCFIPLKGTACRRPICSLGLEETFPTRFKLWDKHGEKLRQALLLLIFPLLLGTFTELPSFRTVMLTSAEASETVVICVSWDLASRVQRSCCRILGPKVFSAGFC